MDFLQTADLLYSQIAMTNVVKKMYEPDTFIRKTFFNSSRSTGTDVIAWDYVRGNKQLAQITNANAQARVMKRDGYKTHFINSVHTKEKILATPNEAVNRLMGQNIFVTQGDAISKRVANILNDDLKILTDRVIRRQEQLCAMAFTEGKLEIHSEDVDFTLDYNMPADNKKEAQTKWNQATADPLDDIQELSNTIYIESGEQPNILLVGQDACNELLKNKQYLKYLDTRRVDFGEVRPEKRESGVVYIGTLKLPKAFCDMYTYNAFYHNEQMEKVYYLDSKKIYMGSSTALTEFAHTILTDISSNPTDKIGAKRWITEDPSGMWLLVESAGIPVIYQPDAFGNMKVLD